MVSRELLPTMDYRTLFAALPGLYLVLLPDSPHFTILEASDAYLRATNTVRDAIIGRGLFEVFPDNPDDPEATGVTNVRASLNTVLASGASHTMKVQKYDVRRSESEGGGFEERYWSPVNAPLLDERGDVRLLLHRVEDVTEFVTVQVRGAEERRQGLAHLEESEQRAAENLFRAEGLEEANRRLRAIITERKQAEEALRESEQRFRGLADNIAQLAWIADGTGWLFWYNQRWFDYTGTTLEEMQGWGWSKVHHADHLERVTAKYKRHLETGEAWEDTFPLRSKDGEFRWFLSRAVPVRDDAGKVTRWFGTNTDITEQRTAEEMLLARAQEIERLNVRLSRAMSETHHRVKNNLQVITALISMQAMQYEETVPVSALERLNQHIMALATIHDLLTHQAKKNVGMDDLSVQETLEQLVPMLQGMMSGRSLRLRVDDLRLPIGQGTTLTILVNELVSNAVKHGQGDIAIVFDVRDGFACLQVEDQGCGFSADFHPISSANTGLELIESLARYDLQGTTRYENRPEGGASILIRFPLPKSSQPAE